MPRIVPNIWLDTESEEAAAVYTSIFPRSRVIPVTRYGEVGPREAGLVMTVEFELDGRRFVAINGGPGLQLQRGAVLGDPLPLPGGDRRVPGASHRRRRRARPVRLAQGPLQRLVAGHA